MDYNNAIHVGLNLYECIFYEFIVYRSVWIFQINFVYDGGCNLMKFAHKLSAPNICRSSPTQISHHSLLKQKQNVLSYLHSNFQWKNNKHSNKDVGGGIFKSNKSCAHNCIAFQVESLFRANKLGWNSIMGRNWVIHSRTVPPDNKKFAGGDKMKGEWHRLFSVLLQKDGSLNIPGVF